MPRKGRGGARQGTPGTAYGNRTDLNTPQPITVAPGQGYGEAAQQRAEQQAVPMAGVATPPTPSTPSTPAPQTPGPQPAANHPVPGQGDIDLFAPADHHMLEGETSTPPGQMFNPNSMLKVAQALSDAASSPYATRQVQELASLAQSLA